VSELEVTQRRSGNGANKKQLDTLRSLGLRRIGHTVRIKDSAQARGMVHAVRHLVEAPADRASRPGRVGLHSLAPAAGSRRPRKRVGRGEGSGTGKTAGRGQKGAGARSGSKRRARLEGGQMPIHMRMRKLRGPHMKKSMPFEAFRTRTQPVNLASLEERFDPGTEVTVELLRSSGLATRKDVPVKVLARGELSKALTVHAHGFSATARERIEAAGGTCVQLGE
jgi:large subunit ribosomal protein L15